MSELDAILDTIRAQAALDPGERRGTGAEPGLGGDDGADGFGNPRGLPLLVGGRGNLDGDVRDVRLAAREPSTVNRCGGAPGPFNLPRHPHESQIGATFSIRGQRSSDAVRKN